MDDVLSVISFATRAQAAQHMTRHNVAHLDLKPDNVLVADDGRLVVCDFGTAVKFPTADMVRTLQQVRARVPCVGPL